MRQISCIRSVITIVTLVTLIIFPVKSTSSQQLRSTRKESETQHDYGVEDRKVQETDNLGDVIGGIGDFLDDFVGGGNGTIANLTGMFNLTDYNISDYSENDIMKIIGLLGGDGNATLVPSGKLGDVLTSILDNATIVDELLQSNGTVDGELIGDIIEDSLGLGFVGVDLNLTGILGNGTLFNTTAILDGIFNETNTSDAWEELQDYLNFNNRSTLVPSGYFQGIISGIFNRNDTDDDGNDGNDNDRNFTLSDIIDFDWNGTSIVRDLMNRTNLTETWDEIRANISSGSSMVPTPTPNGDDGTTAPSAPTPTVPTSTSEQTAVPVGKPTGTNKTNSTNNNSTDGGGISSALTLHTFLSKTTIAIFTTTVTTMLAFM